MAQQVRKSYLISVTAGEQEQRTAMRNALWLLGGSEILPGLFLVALTVGERQQLSRRFEKVRIRQR